jgi:hypothetical protein
VKSDPARANPEFALAIPQALDIRDDVRLQQLWLATQQWEWRSLAVIGAGRAMDTMPIADLFAKIAWWYRGEPARVFDLRDLSLRLVEHELGAVRAQVDAGARPIIALRSIFENPTAIPIARLADAVVVCIRLGYTEFKAAERTIAAVGRERILGSVVLGSRRKTDARRRSGG